MKERKEKKEGKKETNNWVDVKAPKKEMAMDAAIMPASQLGSSLRIVGWESMAASRIASDISCVDC